MGKHPHKLILINHKTWRCTLEGCTFFVHKGLEHILVGKTVICWGCDEEFLFDNPALKMEMPKCIECRQGGIQPIEEAGLPEDMSPERRKFYKELGLIK